MRGMLRLCVIACGVAACAVGANVRNSYADTIVVDSLGAFDAATVNQTQVNFNKIPVACLACFTGFTSPPTIVEGGISFTASSPYINVNGPLIYGTGTYNILTNSSPPGGVNDTLTITLPSSVTAFGLDFGTDGVDQASFSLSNGFSDTVASSYYNAAEFVGFISNQPFDVITLSVPSPNGWGVLYVETASATPLPAALPLFASPLAAFGLLRWRRKRKKEQTVTALSK
jgi:hypothetical protein